MGLRRAISLLRRRSWLHLEEPFLEFGGKKEISMREEALG